jgi:hypothetical protein
MEVKKKKITKNEKDFFKKTMSNLKIIGNNILEVTKNMEKEFAKAVGEDQKTSKKGKTKSINQIIKDLPQ